MITQLTKGACYKGLAFLDLPKITTNILSTMSGKSSEISVVVIGGGAAGITITTALDKTLDPSRHTLTLITQADYLRHHPAALRTVVTAEGNLENDIALPYDKIFGKDKKGGKGRLGTVKFGKVQSIEENVDGTGGFVVLENNQRVQWDYLAIATGSEWNGPLRWPGKREEVKPYLDEWRSKFASAKSIVLVGSGAVGTELAGEIRDFIPSAELTVVNRDALPLNSTYPDVFRRRVLQGLTSRGIKYIGGDAVTSLSADILNGTDPVTPGRTITTDKGVEVAAELIVSALTVFRAPRTHICM
jgi:apoptosis-inducing factor 2